MLTYFCKRLPCCTVVTLGGVSEIILQGPKFLVEIKIYWNITAITETKRNIFMENTYFMLELELSKPLLSYAAIKCKRLY